MVVTTKAKAKKKTPQKSSPRSTRSTKKTVSKSKKKTDTGVVKSTEKKELIADLKTSMKSMWRLPWLIMAPVILFVSKRYESIPADRRKSLKWISKKIKNWSTDGLSHLKDRFKSTSQTIKDTWSKAEKKSKKVVKTTKKKAKKKTASKAKKVVAKKKVAKKSVAKKTRKKIGVDVLF